MCNNNVFDEHLVAIGLKKATREEALQELVQLLITNGYVADSYLDAVLVRESEYPTGLPTAPLGVALPHADLEHVHRTGIAVGILASPIEFHVMGSSEDTVEVSLIFLLAVREAEAQVRILQRLAEVLQMPNILEQLANATEASEVVGVLRSRVLRGG